MVLLIGNESARGGGGKGLCLVCQARPRWSREMFDQPKEHWSYELLRHAARRLGPWVQNPQEIHAHRWRYGRLDFSNELASALSIRIGGRHIWLAGDLFSPGGGIQAAWSSGDSVGARLSTAAGK